MPLQKTLRVPGDKSISHRTLMLGSLSPDKTEFKGLLNSEDVASTQACLQALGATCEITHRHEHGLDGWIQGPKNFPTTETALNVGNSGTTIRLLTGLIAGKNSPAILSGDESLNKRPMGRVITPLKLMNAHITGADSDKLPPVRIHQSSSPLTGIHYEMPIASAQVKSCLLLAGLFAQGDTKITEPLPSRDHTERMFTHLGIPVQRTGNNIQLTGAENTEFTLPASTWHVPGDFSSAAFWIALALLTPDCTLTIENVGINPLRTGLMNALQRVGANIQLSNPRTACGEPVGDLIVSTSTLKGNLLITPQEVPTLIDEIPILAFICLFLDGALTVTGAEELQKKESNRILDVAGELQKLGVTIDTKPDGFVMSGNPNFYPATPTSALETHHDHRTALSLLVLDFVLSQRKPAHTTLPINGKHWAAVSYPHFEQQLANLPITQSGIV
ncbi:MAG: 3-phosphoshikimate 1-carboxyvinyltransferase [Vampirovibrio sp.]|nr:3-phosphoshikimate 1-carboxyvinyltransferase [Vampirovibrio sp.]